MPTFDVCILSRRHKRDRDSDQTINALSFTGDFSFEASTRLPRVCRSTRPMSSRTCVTCAWCCMGSCCLRSSALVFVVASLLRAPRDAARWRAVARGGIWLIVAMIVLGALRVLRVRHGLPALPRDLLPGRQLLVSRQQQPDPALPRAVLGAELGRAGDLAISWRARRCGSWHAAGGRAGALT